MKQLVCTLAKGFINSYGQLFFANSRVFAILLLLSTCVNPIVGASGAFAVLLALFFSYAIGLNNDVTASGFYSYNALMLGLILGGTYSFSVSYGVLLMSGAVISVMLTVAVSSLFAKYNIPVLSFPFLLTLWLLILALRNYTNIHINESELFKLNEWYSIGGNGLVNVIKTIDELQIPELLQVYFKSLSAVFFQYHTLTGIVVAVGLVIWSRIAFVLSVFGFVVGYLFYYTLSGEVSSLNYSFIGFNFILTAIALGGFYVVPSWASFALVGISMPVVGICISALTAVLGVFQLPVYSLPFAIVVCCFILLLKQRVVAKKLMLITYQYYSPENNLYQHNSLSNRFAKNKHVVCQLPFYGEWYVSQGYNGVITHKDDWKYALDFVVVDEHQKTYKNIGTQLTDYYCYNLPVLAVADGYVTEVADGIDDNNIKAIDLQNNWGNTLVIKHADGLYSKLSHLKKDSITVKVNDFVKAGQIIAALGSSGRSPEPHLHFQFQATPYIGSHTINFPLGYFVSRSNSKYCLHEFDIPKQGEHIHQPVKTALLSSAFAFIPGQKIKYKTTDKNGVEQQQIWHCMVNMQNQTYLYCQQTNAVAYYVNNGTVFYFTAFYGNKKSLLYQFYLGAHKICLGYYQNLVVNDKLSPTNLHVPHFRWLSDFVAPFYQLMQVNYQAKYVSVDNETTPQQIVISSTIEAAFYKKAIKQKEFVLNFANNRLQSWQLVWDNNIINAIWED